MRQLTVTAQHDQPDMKLLLWVGIPRSIRPRIGDVVTEDGRTYRVERVVRSKTRRGAVDAECWPEDWCGQEPTGVIVVGGGVQYRVSEILENL